MVVAVNESEGSARVSCRLDGQSVVLDMPLTEVSRRISASAGIQLDNLNGPDSKRRLQSREDGWHFTTREGPKGPYPTEKDAARELARYVLCMQTEPKTARSDGTATAESGTAPAPRRRATDNAEALRAAG